MNDLKIRMFEIMQYEQYYDINIAIDWLKKIDCQFLAVRHDKDNTEPHYHIFVKMNGARALNDIANQLQLKENYINYIKKWKNALAYAFHLTETSKNEKYKYNMDCIVEYKNIDVEEIFNNNQQYEEHKNIVLEAIFKYGRCEISKKSLMAFIDERDFIRYYNDIKKMSEYRNLLIKERNMNVLYIFGSSGTGKTTLAKSMADTFNYDYFVSGSGKDVLDGYDKEECIILDDLRGDVFTKAELFKLLDNNTNSSVKSRFHNKDISNCKLLIITSIKSPAALYNWDEQQDAEAPKQLARRLNYEIIKCPDKATDPIIKFKIGDNLIPTIDGKTEMPMTMAFVYASNDMRAQSQTIDDIFRAVSKAANEKLKNNKDLPF